MDYDSTIRPRLTSKIDIGPVQHVYYNKKNKELSRKLYEDSMIQHCIENTKPIFIFGYGASGSGKTTALIYKDVPGEKENGIIAYFVEYLLPQYPSFTVSAYDFDATQPEGIELFTNKKYSLETLDNFIQCIRKVITGEGEGENEDQGRLRVRNIKPTPVHQKSSRSHVLVHMQFDRQHLFFGDFAGVENSFIQCANNEHAYITSCVVKKMNTNFKDIPTQLNMTVTKFLLDMVEINNNKKKFLHQVYYWFIEYYMYKFEVSLYDTHIDNFEVEKLIKGEYNEEIIGLYKDFLSEYVFKNYQYPMGHIKEMCLNMNMTDDIDDYTYDNKHLVGNSDIDFNSEFNIFNDYIIPFILSPIHEKKQTPLFQVEDKEYDYIDALITAISRHPNPNVTVFSTPEDNWDATNNDVPLLLVHSDENKVEITSPPGTTGAKLYSIKSGITMSYQPNKMNMANYAKSGSEDLTQYDLSKMYYQCLEWKPSFTNTKGDTISQTLLKFPLFVPIKVDMTKFKLLLKDLMFNTLNYDKDFKVGVDMVEDKKKRSIETYFVLAETYLLNDTMNFITGDDEEDFLNSCSMPRGDMTPNEHRCVKYILSVLFPIACKMTPFSFLKQTNGNDDVNFSSLSDTHKKYFYGATANQMRNFTGWLTLRNLSLIHI